MNTNDSTSPRDDHIGDQNVERLLTEAYQPESMDEGFVRRVREQVHAAAKLARNASPVVPRAKATDARTWQLVVGGGVVVVLVAVIAFLTSRQPSLSETPPYYRDGELVWIDGKPYVAASRARNDGKSPPLVPLVGDEQDRSDQDRSDQDRSLRIDDGLTPRPRSEPAEAEQIAAGDSLITRRGERRLVTLSDGSVLYINESSAIKVDANRQITLERGEIFLEVSQDLSKGANANGARFVVKTPQREVTALGTKFSVSVDESGTGVVVTQGKVQVTGVEGALEAGQQLRSGDVDERHLIAPVPRASHVLQWTRDLMATAESPLVPSSEYCGGALVAVDRNGQQTRLSLRKYHVDVHIEDGFARTTIDQTYFNHETGRLEGTFYFPLPPDASISRLAMYVNGRLMEGGMAERARARQVFETIKYRALDPALLEWIDGSTFKMRVFPLEGRQEKRIILSYTQKLDKHYGETRYRFPAGHNMEAVRNWSVKLHIVNGAQGKWTCPSHQLNAAEINGDLVLTAAENDTSLERDIVVDLREKTTSANGEGERARFSSVEHDGWRYLMLRFRPQVPLAERRQRRDWIFLTEADGSRDPLLARVQADIVRRMLENAEHQDTFAIITAATRRLALAPERMPVNRENIEAAAKFLDATHLIGALDLGEALAATQAYARDAENPVLVHIGDGTPILGARQNDKLLGSLPERVRYVGVGVGTRWNRTFMKSAASQTGGYFTQINPDEPTGWRVFELMSTLNAPRLMDLRVETDTNEERFLCCKDGVVHGEEICAIFRVVPNRAEFQSVDIVGSIDGQPYRHSIAVDEVVKGGDYLPRIWAKLAIDEMVALGANRYKAEIVELSKSMYVMSPFTSLLVLENDAMYEEYNVDRGRKDHWALYACPDKIEVVYEPLGPQQGPHPVGATPVKPTPDAVLRSLLVSDPAAPLRGDVRDDGTMFWGGMRRPDAGLGVPMLSGVPHVNRWFASSGLDPADTKLMMMVTPRILIQEEEQNEDSLGVGSLGEFRFGDVAPGADNSGTADFDTLIDLITTTVAPDSWDDVGGPGSIAPFPGELSLVISNTQTVHDEIDNPFPDEPPIVYPDAASWSELSRQHHARYENFNLAETTSSADQRILATLKEKTDANYVDRPFKEVIDDLAFRHDIPIFIYTSVLENFDIRMDEPITLMVSGISLRSVLTLAISELELEYFIEDGVLKITAAEDASTIAPAYWHDEILLPLRTGDGIQANGQQEPTKSFSTPTKTDPRTFNRWCEHVTRRLAQNASRRNLLYVTPQPFDNRRMFQHVLALVPALRTTQADILAALESEAELPNPPRPGKIDERARELIDAVRGRTWQQVTLHDRAGHVVLQLQVDGQGRFLHERKTEHGLRETVVCDGKTLRHLYPELGLGTVRRMSRFHRAELAGLVPWLLPPAEDLAIGADLRMIGPRTVAIAPHAHDQATDGEDAPRPHVRVHLVFADDGGLAEQRWVSIPGGETVGRTTYMADGTVHRFGPDGGLRDEYQVSTEQCSAPDLSPDTKHLVVLPMPVRDRGHVYELVKTGHEAAANATDRIGNPSHDQPQDSGILEQIALNQERASDDEPAGWNDDDTLRLVAACYRQDPTEMRNIIARRFFARGDRRVGFYTLLLSSGVQWDPADPVALDDGTTIRMDPLADHPESPLAQYIASQREGLETAASEVHQSIDEQDGFIGQLARYRRLCSTWRHVGQLPIDAEVRRRDLDEAFEFIARCDSPIFSLALLRRLQNRCGDSQPHGRIAEALVKLEKQGVTSYVVKYELARSLAENGKRDHARQLFLQLYQETLNQGLLPPIDEAFCEAMTWQHDDGNLFDPFGDTFGDDPFGGPLDSENTEPEFEEVMQAACGRLVEQHQRPLAIALAWQFRRLGHVALADRLFDQALTGLTDSERVVTTLAALDYLVHTGRFDRADALLQPLLEDATYAALPSLWRMAAQIAGDGNKLARSIRYLEKAIDLDFDALTGSYDVEQVRENYQQIFETYEKLANILAMPDNDVPLDLVARTIRQADRWRFLDTDATLPCHAAARLLSALGQAELAWDYLTTPLAMKPNEAAPWIDLAKTLIGAEQFELASRAYTAAFEAESTNAQILWDHAQLLEQGDHSTEAQKLYTQIATGAWQPRFDHLKRKAQRMRESFPPPAATP